MDRRCRLLEETLVVGVDPDLEAVLLVHRRRRALTLIGVPVVAIGLAAAGWAVLHEDAREAASFACLAEGVTAVLPNDGTPPVEACADLWESGGMVQGVTNAPPLAACVDGHSVVAVIEADGVDTCASAGMADWDDQPAYEAVGGAVRSVRTSLHDRFQATGNGCATEADWRSGLAGEPGAEGWKVEVDQVESNRHCYDIGSVNPSTRTLTIIGVPGDYSIGCDPRTGC